MKKLLILMALVPLVIGATKLKRIEHFYVPNTPVTVLQTQSEYAYFELNNGETLGIMPDGSIRLNECCEATHDDIVKFLRQFARENK